MNFRRIDPPAGLRNILECCWVAESDDPTTVIQKIIPDGFPEVIFHFGDPYQIKLKSRWEQQPASLLAGQITGHFFLKNMGRSSMLGLKFQPAALTHLFGIPMHSLNDRVVELSAYTDKLQIMETQIRNAKNFEERLSIIEVYLGKLPVKAHQAVDQAIRLIFDAKGTIPVRTLCDRLGIGERQLERVFKTYVGLTPKFYARIIRFSHIFQAVTSGNQSWTQLGLEVGFYDQSHFIKNFKAFTGEDPSGYFFDDPNLANFFLKK